MLLLMDRILQFLDQRLRIEYLPSSIGWQRELELARFGTILSGVYVVSEVRIISSPASY